MELAEYFALRGRISTLGYTHEIEWAQNVQPVSDPITFWRGYSWVVLNNGMKNQIAADI